MKPIYTTVNKFDENIIILEMKEVKTYYECKMCENFFNCLGDLQMHMLLNHLLKIDCQKSPFNKIFKN